MNHNEEFIDLVTDCQGRLFGYLMAVLGDPDLANDVLQETNLVIWRKSEEFQLGTNFDAWAFRIASFQVMAFRQRQTRDKLLFDQGLVEQITHRSQRRAELYEAKMQQLAKCIEQLPERSRKVINLRYIHGENLQEIGEKLDQTQNAIGQLIFRIKKKLIQCISKTQGKLDSDGIG